MFQKRINECTKENNLMLNLIELFHLVDDCVMYNYGFKHNKCNEKKVSSKTNLQFGFDEICGMLSEIEMKLKVYYVRTVKLYFFIYVCSKYINYN